MKPLKIIEVKFDFGKECWVVSASPILGFETRRSAINFALNLKHDLLVVYDKRGKYKIYASDSLIL